MDRSVLDPVLRSLRPMASGRHHVALGAMCIALATSLTGCKPPASNSKPAEATAESSRPQGLRGSLPGGAAFQAQTGAAGKIKLPDGFPDDIPIYQDAQPTTVISLGAMQTFQFQYTDAKVPDLTTYYLAEMPSRGWTKGSDLVMPEGGTLSFTKDGRKLDITVASTGVTGTTLQLSLPR